MAASNKHLMFVAFYFIVAAQRIGSQNLLTT